MRKSSLNVKKSLFKLVYTSEKVILSIAKRHFKYRKESKVTYTDIDRHIYG